MGPRSRLCQIRPGDHDPPVRAVFEDDHSRSRGREWSLTRRSKAAISVETAELFNRIASHYDFWSNLLSVEGMRAGHHFSLDAMCIQPGDAVLDVGCAVGMNTLAMAERAGKQGCVVGIDPPWEMMHTGQARSAGAHAAPISWVLGQGEHLPFSAGEFDAVSTQFSLRNREDWPQALREMVRVLKPEGRLVVLDVVQLLTTLGVLAWTGLKSAVARLNNPALSSYQWRGLSIDHAPTTEELRFSFLRQDLANVWFHHWLGDLVVTMVGQKQPRTAEPDRGEAQSPTLLWAVDGSTTARAAADWINVFLPVQSRVEIVTAMPATGASRAVPATDAHIWHGRAIDADAAACLMPGRFQVHLHVVGGEPGPTIVRLARKAHAGLIVAGGKGGSMRRDQWVGSVSRHVLDHAPCPVLIVPTAVLGNAMGQFAAKRTAPS